jgi:hypothetical protein
MASSKTRRSGVIRRRARPTRRSSRFSWLNLAPDSLPSLLFPADVLGPDAPEHARVEIDLIVTDPQGVELQRLQLQLTRRLRSKETIQLWGTDKDKILTVQLTKRSDGSWTFYSRADTEVLLNGRQFLSFLDFVEALRPPNEVALAAPGEPASRRSKLKREATNIAPPTELRELIEAHAAVERSLGVQVPVPDTYTTDQGKALFKTAALLRGETVTSTWDRLKWPMSVAEARVLASGIFQDNGQATLEYERAWTLELGEHKVPVGTVLAEYRSARLSPVDLANLEDDDDITLQLQPGDESTVSFRLLEGPAPREGGGELGSEQASDSVDQRWFWTPAWQEREREVDLEIAKGNVQTHSDADTFLAHIDRLVSDVE